MKFLKVALCIITAILFLEGISFSNEKEELPKIAFIRNDGANIRAGDNVNFESLCILEKDDPVKIVARRYSWFKIILPNKAHMYIKDSYVDLSPEEKTTGMVNAIHVNLRAGPDTKHSILAQASKPEILKILSEKNGWYQIMPTRGSCGWIHSSQIKFVIKGAKRN